MINQISLKNFRNLDLESIKLSPQSNVIIAPNGSGKTNFIESIYFLVLGKSFKPVENNIQLIGPKEKFFRINLEAENNDSYELVISNEDNRFTRKLSLNTKKIPVSKILDRLPILLFAPNSVDLVANEPGLRRDDLDNYLSMIDSTYRQNTESYQKVLKNRNVLIKMIREGKSSRNELSFWTNKIADLADYIFKTRLKFFKEINEFLDETVIQMKILDLETKITSLYIEYKPNLESEIESFKLNLLNKYEENIDKEIIVGKTLYGTHKDDFSILMNGENLRFYGSRGQQRLGVLLFKLSQSNHYFSLKSTKPLFLIDDLMSELDDFNRVLAADLVLGSGNQFILTSADEDEVPEKLQSISNLIKLKQS
ncbi:MAG: DNA replication and repair protein RecF [Candidatus Dojkabacteria bacterium]